MNFGIIAAGESSRLKAEGLNTAKHLIKVGGECLIERIIRIARLNKAKNVFCIINEQEEELKEFLTKTDFGIPVKLIVKTTVSSMHSLFALAPYLYKESFCLATTDSVFDENEFAEFLNYSKMQKFTDGTLAVTRYIDDEKPLCVAMDEDDTILKFSDTKEGYNWATGGIYFFSPKIFDEMHFALSTGIEKLRNYLRLLIGHGYTLKGFSFSKIIDVDHVSDIEKAEQFISSLNSQVGL